MLKSKYDEFNRWGVRNFSSPLIRDAYLRIRAEGPLAYGYAAKIRLADAFDKMDSENDKFLHLAVQSLRADARDRWRDGGLVNVLESMFLNTESGMLDVFQLSYDFATFIAKGYVDVLRLGQGALEERSAWGVSKDALRLLSLIPVGRALKLISGAARTKLLAQVAVQAAPMECGTNSAVRAAYLAGAKLFVRVVDIWAESGVRMPRDVMNHGIHDLQEIVPVLRGVGVPAGDRILVTSVEQVAVAAKNNPNSALIIGIRYTYVANGVKQVGRHAMLATAIEGTVKFYDTTGRVFANAAELNSVYGREGAVGFEQMVLVGETAAVVAKRQAAEFLLPAIPDLLQMMAVRVTQTPIFPLVADQVLEMARQENPPASAGGNQTQATTAANGSGTKPAATPPSTTPELKSQKRTVLVQTGDGQTSRYTEQGNVSYTIRPGDTLQLISTHFYRSPTHWNVIYNANRTKVGPPPKYTLLAGRQLVIP
jgi:nucleoid-associated protein YgaU